MNGHVVRTLTRRAAFLCIAPLMIPALLRPQDDSHMHHTGPMVHLGAVAFPNSGAKAAQPAFLRGLALLHNFQYDEATAAFREAEELDPRFAMAYWGEAMSYNHGVWREQDSVAGRAALARLGATPADRLAKAPTPREKDYLRAIDVLYSTNGTKQQRDSAYASTMRQLATRYKNDPDAQLFHALALLSLFPRTDSTYLQAGAIADSVMRTHPNHPGALHYVIHAYDDPNHAQRGLEAARRYSTLAPDAPHALHMTSHIFIARGMWDDVVSANEAALRMNHAPGVAPRGVAARCGHAGLWLQYAYLQQGRFGDARRMMETCRDSSNGVADIGRDYSEMRSRYVIDDLTQQPPEPVVAGNDGMLSPPGQFLQDFTTAYVALRHGDTAVAAPALQRLHDVRATKLVATPGKPAYPITGAAAVMEEELDGLMLLDRGKRDEGFAQLRRATADEDALEFAFGPPLVEKPSHELLGEILLENGQAQEARREFERALTRTPGRSLALLDLARASRAAGDNAAAWTAYKQAVENWHRADGKLPPLADK